jgi:CheY-like chemotaxis protein
MPTPSTAPPRKYPPGEAPFVNPIRDSMEMESTHRPAVEVLLVTAAVGTHALFTKAFESSNWRLEAAATPAEALQRLRQNPMAVVIYEDMDAPCLRPVAREEPEQESWLELLIQTRHLHRPPKVIVASRRADDRMWAEVLHQGGYDVLPLPLESAEVLRTVSTAWLEWRHEHDSNPAARAMAVGASY